MKKLKFLMLCLIIFICISVNIFGQRRYPIDFVKNNNKISASSDINERCKDLSTYIWTENYHNNETIQEYNFLEFDTDEGGESTPLDRFCAELSFNLLRGYSYHRMINILGGYIMRVRYFLIDAWEEDDAYYYIEDESERYEMYKKDVYNGKSKNDEYAYYYMLSWYIMFTMSYMCLYNNNLGLRQLHVDFGGNHRYYIYYFSDYIDFINNYKFKSAITPIMYKAREFAQFAIDNYDNYHKNDFQIKYNKEFVLYEVD